MDGGLRRGGGPPLRHERQTRRGDRAPGAQGDGVHVRRRRPRRPSTSRRRARACRRTRTPRRARSSRHGQGSAAGRCGSSTGERAPASGHDRGPLRGGGSSIGPRVAERLGVPFLDREVRGGRPRAGLSEDAVADVDEEPRSGWNGSTSLGRASTLAAAGAGPVSGVDLQERGSAAGSRSSWPTPALGRGGDRARRDGRPARRPWALHVYLGGPRERAHREGMALDGIDHGTAERRRRSGPARRGYVRRAYGVDGDEPEPYHLMLDSTAIERRHMRRADRGGEPSAPAAPGSDPTELRSGHAGTARHADAGTQVARRALAVRARRRGRGRDEGWWKALLAGAREIPVPASYNDIFPEAEVHDHVGDAWYETTVRVPARLGRRADRAALRLRHASRGGLGRRHAGRRARRGLHAVRGRRHRARRAGRREPGDRGRQQRPELAVDPAGLRRRHARTARASATSTTSSTTPGCTGRSGSTPRRSPTSRTSPW